jgi:hypothetical protein
VRVALDENIPEMMVRVFETLAHEKHILNAEIISARAYRPNLEKGDDNWVRRFAAAGGDVVISGDVRMRSSLHERAALAEAGVITYCFTERWSQFDNFVKSALLLKWWPAVATHMQTARRGSCWEIPMSWNIVGLKDVSADPTKLSKTKKV